MDASMNRTVAERDAEEAAEEARLTAARETFPGWEIRETFGGYLAVPKGSAVIYATSVDGMVLKLRQAREASL